MRVEEVEKKGGKEDGSPTMPLMLFIKELKRMIKTIKYDSPVEFEHLAKTISDWFAPIIRMWRFTKNNSITEGFHRKMKLIRMAYGYRNFENYRLRVLVLCGVFH